MRTLETLAGPRGLQEGTEKAPRGPQESSKRATCSTTSGGSSGSRKSRPLGAVLEPSWGLLEPLGHRTYDAQSART
eukprot:9492191-Pyramimonas_sp.AAC.1